MEHPDTALDHHDRTEFQLERLILFTDAVFAIAITLLAIELKVPEFEHRPSGAEVRQALLALLPRFIGFLISFVVIARYWMAHHRIFRFVRTYNQRLIGLNMLFLLTIVLMPFTTALYSEYPTTKAIFAIYSAGVVASGLCQILMQSYLSNPRHGLVWPSDVYHPDLHPAAPLVPVLGFGLSLLLLPVVPAGFYMLLPFLILPFALLRNRWQKKLVARHTRMQALHFQRTQQ